MSKFSRSLNTERTAGTFLPFCLTLSPWCQPLSTNPPNCLTKPANTATTTPCELIRAQRNFRSPQKAWRGVRAMLAMGRTSCSSEDALSSDPHDYSRPPVAPVWERGSASFSEQSVRQSNVTKLVK